MKLSELPKLSNTRADIQEPSQRALRQKIARHSPAILVQDVDPCLYGPHRCASGYQDYGIVKCWTLIIIRCRWSENDKKLLPRLLNCCVLTRETDHPDAPDPDGLDGKSGLGEVKKRVRCISVEKLRDRWLPGLLD